MNPNKEDLNKKLEHLKLWYYFDNGSRTPCHLISEDIVKIKQAFLDLGWTPPKYTVEAEPRKAGDD